MVCVYVCLDISYSLVPHTASAHYVIKYVRSVGRSEEHPGFTHTKVMDASNGLPGGTKINAAVFLLMTPLELWTCTVITQLTTNLSWSLHNTLFLKKRNSLHRSGMVQRHTSTLTGCELGRVYTLASCNIVKNQRWVQQVTTVYSRMYKCQYVTTTKTRTRGCRKRRPRFSGLKPHHSLHL